MKCEMYFQGLYAKKYTINSTSLVRAVCNVIIKGLSIVGICDRIEKIVLADVFSR